MDDRRAWFPRNLFQTQKQSPNNRRRLPLAEKRTKIPGQDKLSQPEKEETTGERNFHRASNFGQKLPRIDDDDGTF